MNDYFFTSVMTTKFACGEIMRNSEDLKTRSQFQKTENVKSWI